MDDLISRSAALGVLLPPKEHRTYQTFNLDDAYDEGWGDYQAYVAQIPPTLRWIPMTERSPKIDMSYPHHEDYLVQYDSGNMDVASWSNVNRFWTDHVTEPYWNCVQFAKVVAWMPLPEPYERRRG